LFFVALRGLFDHHWLHGVGVTASIFTFVQLGEGDVLVLAVLVLFVLPGGSIGEAVDLDFTLQLLLSLGRLLERGLVIILVEERKFLAESTLVLGDRVVKAILRS
jgi:hypothetical protein